MEFVGYSPGLYTRRFIIKRQSRRERSLEHKKKRGFKQRVVISNPDEDYGAVEEQISEEEIKSRKDKLESLLRKTAEEISQIEQNTRTQSSNPLWHQERAFRITASNFGRICKLKATTKPNATVKNLLYKRFTGNSATKYGQEHEIIAIQDFEELTGLTVTDCGLFIGHDDEYFLGASPDGLVVDDDSIVEVKCPETLKNRSLEQGIAEKKINFMTIDENGTFHLKANHDYYYQIQGQLHISQRECCYFIVWSPVGPLHIEKITKDDNFWQNKMKPKLMSFFSTALIPEIIKNKL